MFKLIILIKKKPTLSDDEFAKYFLETHAPLAKTMPGVRKYAVSFVKRPPNREPDYHAVAELWFNDIAAMKSAFASAEGKLTQKDNEAFAESVTSLFTDEHSIV
ncbi:MAG TPA: EthD family reductase [Terriglobales bacterium]|nr:EthD family reductase [Terriglobales bacterium]